MFTGSGMGQVCGRDTCDAMHLGQRQQKLSTVTGMHRACEASHAGPRARVCCQRLISPTQSPSTPAGAEAAGAGGCAGVGGEFGWVLGDCTDDVPQCRLPRMYNVARLCDRGGPCCIPCAWRTSARRNGGSLHTCVAPACSTAGRQQLGTHDPVLLSNTSSNAHTPPRG